MDKLEKLTFEERQDRLVVGMSGKKGGTTQMMAESSRDCLEGSNAKDNRDRSVVGTSALEGGTPQMTAASSKDYLEEKLTLEIGDQAGWSELRDRPSNLSNAPKSTAGAAVVGGLAQTTAVSSGVCSSRAYATRDRAVRPTSEQDEKLDDGRSDGGQERQDDQGESREASLSQRRRPLRPPALPTKIQDVEYARRTRKEEPMAIAIRRRMAIASPLSAGSRKRVCDLVDLGLKNRLDSKATGTPPSAERPSAVCYTRRPNPAVVLKIIDTAIARGVERCMMLPTGGAWEVMGWMEGNGRRFGVWRLIRGLTPRDLTASGNAPTLKRKSNTYKIHHVASRRRGGPYPPPRSSSTLNSAAGRIRPIDLIAVAIVYRVLPVCGAYASRSSCWLLSFPWRRLKVVSWSSNADSKSSADADVADSESSNSSIVADVKSSDGKGEIWERR
ncbi:hypothetical protein BDZ89DRAFT_1046335 [Hymenopellis radicata]|nr:hypothetical protein BDZ89DRAFT_1046335 [Hymenopellis radicata]